MLLKFKTERDQIIESNESKDHDGKLPVPEIPSQLIALMLKFTILCAKEERIEKCRPRLDSGATEKAGKGKDKPKSPKKGGKGKDDSATGEAINKDCVRGHELVEQLLSNMKIANFPLKELLDSESKLWTRIAEPKY